ncbi:MAG TPA: hypothetical protein VEP29_02920, partial [Desulfatiglandales bacterium]|nr:hypothetical protein [Desulfatiglandales bacterium]
ADSHTIALTVRSIGGRFMVHIMVNAYWEGLEFEIPSVPELSGGWMRWIDTSRESPDDICPWNEAVAVQDALFPVQSRSVGVLVSQIKNKGK